MPFDEPYSLGTVGGIEDTTLPITPQMVRVYRGSSLIGYLVINQPILTKLREEVEEITRILERLEDTTQPVFIYDNSLLVDSNLEELSFDAVISVISNGNSDVSIYIPVGSISTIKLSGIVANSRTIGNLSLGNNEFADNAITTVKLIDGGIAPTDLDRTYLETFPAGKPLIVGTPTEISLLTQTGGTTSILPTNITLPNDGIMYDITYDWYIITFTTNLSFTWSDGTTWIENVNNMTQRKRIGVNNIGDGTTLSDNLSILLIGAAVPTNVAVYIFGQAIAYPRQR
jgi:hypothetical protein